MQNIDYQFLKWSFPIQHLGGRVQFEPIETGTRVTWMTSYDSTKIPDILDRLIQNINQAFLLYSAICLTRIAFKANDP